jgi:hypothetical protein
MIEETFECPEPELARRETARRQRIVAGVTPKLQTVSSGIVLFGSMAYGSGYSVTEKSDIDLVVLTDFDLAKKIADLDLFDPGQTRLYVEGFGKGIGKQFSLNAEIDGVIVECHFWDRAAYSQAIALKTQDTIRFRSSQTKDVNYSFSFLGEKFKSELPSKVVEKWIISPFPTFQIHENQFCPCRPLTNLLGSPRILYDQGDLQKDIDNLWIDIVGKLLESTEKHLDLMRTNVLNSLPGKKQVFPASVSTCDDSDRKRVEETGNVF